MAESQPVFFSRVHVEMINNGKVAVNADYAFAEYLATKSFFQLLSDLQGQLIEGGNITLSTGQTVDPQTTGGLIAIQIYTESLDSMKQAMSGLAKLGLSIEKQVWKNI